MTLDDVKEKKELVPIALLGFSVVLAGLIVVKVRGFVVSTAKAKESVSKAVSQDKSDANDLGEYLSRFKSAADALKKKNLFAPAPPKQNPVKSVLGIFGVEAFVNSKWQKEGDKVGDATIVSIEPTRVKVEWSGQEKFFAPIDIGGGPGAGPGGRPRGGERGPERGRPDGGRPEIVRVEGGRPPMGFGGGRMSNMSPEEREAMRQRFTNMSESERQAFREKMRERFSSRGGRFGGDRGRGGEASRRSPGRR